MHFSKTVLERLYKKFNTFEFKDIMQVLDLDIVDIRGVVAPLWVAYFPKISDSHRLIGLVSAI